MTLRGAYGERLPVPMRRGLEARKEGQGAALVFREFADFEDVVGTDFDAILLAFAPRAIDLGLDDAFRLLAFHGSAHRAPNLESHKLSVIARFMRATQFLARENWVARTRAPGDDELRVLDSDIF
jgi:hypothetical protein